PTTLYAVTENHGLWKSTDGGDHWSRNPFGARRALAIDPLTPATLYATTGWESDAVQGTHKSTDGGASWSRVDTGPISALAIDPQTPAIVYAGTGRGGVYKSIDAGSTWNAVNIGLTDFNVSALAVDPRTTTTLYAGTCDGYYNSCGNSRGGGVFKSTD